MDICLRRDIIVAGRLLSDINQLVSEAKEVTQFEDCKTCCII